MIKRIMSLPIAHPVYRCTVRHRGLSAFRQRQMKEPAWSFKSTPIVCWSTSLIMGTWVDAEIKENVSAQKTNWNSHISHIYLTKLREIFNGKTIHSPHNSQRQSKIKRGHFFCMDTPGNWKFLFKYIPQVCKCSPL